MKTARNQTSNFATDVCAKNEESVHHKHRPNKGSHITSRRVRGKVSWEFPIIVPGIVPACR